MTFSATDQNTGEQVALGSACQATAANTPSSLGTASGFAWSATCTFGSNFWSPQNSTGTATALGRLEVTGALTGSTLPMYTFTSAAEQCTLDKMSDGMDAETAGLECHDGTSLVLFDNDGVGWPAETQPWSQTDLTTGEPLPQGTMTAANGVNVTWEVGEYTVQDKNIYALLCYPTHGTQPFPVLIANHGLMGSNGVATGIVQSTWDGCTKMAANGWLEAVSTYRGETISGLPDPYKAFTATSDGTVELCLGEVTDVLRLTTLVTQMSMANPNQVLMWGHSHGACITTRAIEQQAPVQIAVEESAPTDFMTWLPTINKPHYPQRGDEWRSPTNFEDDVIARGDVKLLMIQGAADTEVPYTQACELAAPITTSTNYYVNASGSGSGAPPLCGSDAYPSMKWQQGALPTGTWPSPTLLLYTGYDHGSILPGAWARFRAFVNGFASSQGWPASIPSSYVTLE